MRAVQIEQMERHLISWDLYRKRRSAALAELRVVMGQGQAHLPRRLKSETRCRCTASTSPCPLPIGFAGGEGVGQDTCALLENTVWAARRFNVTV